MGGSTATLSIVLKLVDEASAKFQSIGQSIQSIAVPAGVMGAAITGALALAVKQAADNVTVETQLTSAIKAGIAAAQDDTASTGLLTKQKALLQSQLDGLNGKIQEYNDKIAAGKDVNGQYAAGLDALQQKVAGVQDKLATLNNEQKLATQTTESIVKQFDAAAKAGTDYGFENDDTIKTLTSLFRATGDVNESLKANQEAMDLARAKGIDLSTAGTLIIQAMEGNGRALKQFGINLKDGLTPAEALNELQIKLAGSAKDYVNTPWGQLDVANAKFSLVKETIGGELLPILQRLVAAIVPIIDKMTAWMDAHPKLTQAIIIIVAVVGLLLTALGLLGGAILLLTPVFTTFGVIIAAVSLPLLALIVIVGVLTVFILTHWQQIKDGTQALLFFVQAIWINTWTAVSDFFRSMWNGIKSTFQTAVDFITGLMNSLYSTVSGIINKILSAVSSVTGAVSSVAGAASSAGSFVMHTIVPHLAAGGIVTGPTLSLIGEAGPEAVIPLSRLGSVGGPSINITITGNNISSQLDVRGIAQTVSAEIVRILRTNQKLSI